MEIYDLVKQTDKIMKKPILKKKLFFCESLLVLVLLNINIVAQYDVSNNIVNSRIELKNSSIRAKTTYNNVLLPNGKQIKVKSTFSEFDREGNLTHLVIYLKDGSVATDVRHKYDGAKVTETITKKSNSKMNTRTEYRYDPEGKLLGIDVYKESDEKLVESNYTYSDENLLLKMVTQNSDKSVYLDFSYKYNSDKKLIETVSTDAQGKLQALVKIVYDMNGNISEQMTFDSNNNLLQTTQKKYNADSKLIGETILDGQGRVISKFDRKYKNGEVEDIVANPAANILKRIVSKLNDKGIVISKETYNKLNKKVSSVENNYEYFPQ